MLIYQSQAERHIDLLYLKYSLLRQHPNIIFKLRKENSLFFHCVTTHHIFLSTEHLRPKQSCAIIHTHIKFLGIIRTRATALRLM